MLKTATIVSDDSKDDEVGMDDIVEVYFEEDDEIEKYKLVTSIRGNSMENRISIESPIGMALKGHKVGDRVEVKVNDNYSYFLESVLLIRPVPKMKKSADSDNNTVEIQNQIDKRTIVRDEYRLVSYLLQWFFLFLY